MSSKVEPKSIGGSVFWILLVLISIMAFSLLGFYGFTEDNVRIISIAVMYAIMILFSIAFSYKQIFDLGSWTGNVVSFSLGFFIWILAGLFFGNQSFITLSTNHLLEGVIGNLPQFIELLLNVILVPIAEELFWMFGLTFGLFTILNVMGKSNKIFKNPVLQISVIAIIGGVTFAIFHVGKLFLAFLIGAFIFRAVMVVFVYGEQKFDWLKRITLLPSFAVGAHIANNMVQTGISQFFVVVNSNFFPVGWVIYLFFGVIFISAIIGIVDYFGKKSEEIA
jgi:hypothetical protein